MDNIGKFIKDRREQLGLTQLDIANAVGVSEATISRWESRQISNMKRHRMGALAKILQVPPSSLIEWDEEGQIRESVDGVLIPVLGQVAAGIPITAVEDILDYEEITQEMASQGEHIALRIKGDSMEPKISDGDVVIVRLQEDASTGDTVVALVNGEEATVKRLKKSANGITLIPTNPCYEPIYFTNEEIEQLPVRIIGKVVELRAKF